MPSTINAKLQQLKIEFLLKSDEYKQALRELVANIVKQAKKTTNEASVVGVFEVELFSFIKETLGLRYYPAKEVAVKTIRHINKGRIDSKIGALIIEYKAHNNLTSALQKKLATEQLANYLTSLYNANKTEYLGLLTDGINAKFIRIEKGEIIDSAFEPLSFMHLDEIIKCIILLERKALTPENLVKDFCDPFDDSVAKELTLALFSILKNSPTNKTLMLLDEWKELFKLAHDDLSKQRAIEERKAVLATIVDQNLTNSNDEYIALFALQTTYAIIVKIIAFKVISKIRFSKSLIDFNVLAESDYNALQMTLSSIEEGDIFRTLGIGNLLEGDFFAWYSTESQWDDKVAAVIQKFFSILAKYEDKAIFETGDNVQDLFKDLFIHIIPDKVRHNLGEFYTPPWLADNSISNALDLLENKAQWNALDPCSGSGTFLTVLIKKVMEESKKLSNKEKLKQILSRVKGIDLNPLAVLTCRINYFINISPLISDDDEFEIPVYLGDSSYVPEKVMIDNVSCLKYRIKTIKNYIEIEIPQSAVSDPMIFSRTMTSIEQDIKAKDCNAIVDKLLAIIREEERKEVIIGKINLLAEQFVELERNDWNGIWARIVTNFLTTANLGKFDLIVGNPPWIDWKNLPAGYRDRIKSLCISRHLFSGDSITGGINLNICALISSVAAENWLSKDGILAFLMPQSLVFQQSYEGFRNFYIRDSERLYFQKIFDWTKSGHPFKPVQQKFLTYFISSKPQNYSKGLPLFHYKKKTKADLKEYRNHIKFDDIKELFDIKEGVIGQVIEDTTIFTYAKNKAELKKYSGISGTSYYIGREGIEFYPQELFLLEIDDGFKINKDILYVKNFQNGKSKYKIPLHSTPLEKKYLHPLIKGVDIERYHVNISKFIVPFPYTVSNPRAPIPLKELRRNSKLLSQYFLKFKKVIDGQTNYNQKIIGAKHSSEFYSLARVGKYSFADNFVIFRDNTKWQAAVVTSIDTPWGGKKMPVFQNHAVSISQDCKGSFITNDEAHYICAMLNAPITGKFIESSSDSRSFKIRQPVFIPKFDKHNPIHMELAKLSKEAHQVWNNKERIKEIDKKIDKLCLMIKH